MIKPWPTLGTKHLGDFHVFSLRSDRKVSPRTGVEHEFYILNCTNWVNVLALTPDDELVMIEQYRHGTNTVELEIPGGVMDAGETDPVATAIRELREETGYEGANARILGRVAANPAILTNTVYTVLIENCRLTQPVEFDQGEDLLTRLVPVSEVTKMVAEEKFQHSLVVVALYYFDLWRRGQKKV
ncbi:MAG: NUDIX hydrolase [Verrucomicrobia bacterium]|nr:MAG: NUDIX hydrolase [Verrucomicrobiota bacterium]